MVTAVILAAGQARRMGQPKQLLPLGEKTMVWQVASTACQADVDEVLVITGAYDAEITQSLQGLPIQIVYNADWMQGQSTSVKKAVASVHRETQAVVFLLADQPLVNVVLINELVTAFRKAHASIVMPRWQGRPGNPVLFDLGVWRMALLMLTGDEGARQIIRQHPEVIHYLERNDEQEFSDVDTPVEYEIVKKIWHDMKKKLP